MKCKFKRSLSNPITQLSYGLSFDSFLWNIARRSSYEVNLSLDEEAKMEISWISKFLATEALKSQS